MEENQIEFDIDEYALTNEEIFEKEENQYQETNTYFLLSMMSCVLLDLGIMVEE